MISLRSGRARLFSRRLMVARARPAALASLSEDKPAPSRRAFSSLANRYRRTNTLITWNPPVSAGAREEQATVQPNEQSHRAYRRQMDPRTGGNREGARTLIPPARPPQSLPPRLRSRPIVRP
jgi:hypothetical protein